MSVLQQCSDSRVRQSLRIGLAAQMLGALQSVRLRETNLPLESYVASIGKDDHHSRRGTPSPRVRDPHYDHGGGDATMAR